jgi:hypothetical protein
VAVRREFLDEPVEGQFGVVHGLRDHVPYVAQQFGEAVPLVHGAAQHHRVGEEPDQPLQVHVVTPRDDGADGDVLSARAPGQQQHAGRQQRHVQRGALLAAQRGEPVAELREHSAPDAARGAGACGAGPVPGQFERCHAVQPPPPVGEVAIGEGVLRHAAVLPDGVVRVPQRQRREVGRRPRTGHGCRVAGAEFGGQHFVGPVVGDDVMRRQGQEVFVLAEPDEPGPQQRQFGQIEGVSQVGALQSLRRGLALRPREPTEVAVRQAQPGPGVHDLDTAARLAAERGAQPFVARDDPVQRDVQRDRVQRSDQP